VSFQRALVHTARCSFVAAALVEEMLGHEPPGVEDLGDALLRLDDLVNEAESARSELRGINPANSPFKVG
jgi:hypothetical protein